MRKNLSFINEHISDEIYNKSNEVAIELDFMDNNPFPIGREREKNIMIRENRYKTRSFSKKFKLYINDFTIKSPDGIYTWMLLKCNDKVVFLCSRAYNKLEIHAKHAFLIYKFNDYVVNELNNTENIYKFICSGELEKKNDTIKYNFSSGTYMGNIKLTYHNEIMDYILSVFGFNNIIYLNDINTIIDQNISDDFLTSLPGATHVYKLDNETFKKLDPMNKIKLQTQFDILLRQYKKINREVPQSIIDEYMRNMNELDELNKQISKYRLRVKNLNKKSRQIRGGKKKSRRQIRSGKKKSRRQIRKS